MAGRRSEVLELGTLSSADEIARQTRGRAVTDYTRRVHTSEVRWPNGTVLRLEDDRLTNLEISPRDRVYGGRVIDLTQAGVTAVGNKGSVFIGERGRLPSESGGVIIERRGVVTPVPSEFSQMY